MNKLGIFLTYDADGVVDDYIPYLLNDINRHLDRLVIVVNGILNAEGRKKLERISSDIYVRENIGFDFCAWKDAMINYIGFPKIREYDQLVLFNDSFFGPLRSFKEVFDEMDDRNLDFWGLTVHGEVNTVKDLCPYGYRPRYIQTYFMAFNKRIINDYSFQNYWTNIPVYTTFQEVAEKCSAVLTKYFEDMGFSWGVYSDTSDLETDRTTNICHHAFNINELVTNRKYPIIKRKSFVLGKARYLKNNTGLDLVRAINYIDEHTEYDLNLIYSHIARRYDIAEIKESLNLNYILDEKKPSDINKNLINKAIGIIYLDQRDQSSLILKYLENIPSQLAILIVTNSESKRENIICEIDGTRLANQVEVLVESKATNYIYAYYLGAKKYALEYEYFLFLHNNDKKCTNEPFVVGKSCNDLLWENMVYNEQYIGKILQLLSDNEYLGMLVPPVPFHGKYYSKACSGYGDLSDNVEYWNILLDTNCNLVSDHSPISYGGVCWCKKKILDSIIKSLSSKDIAIDIDETITSDKMEVFEYLLPYLTSQAELLTGWVMTSEYAASEIESLRYAVNSVYKVTYGENYFGINSFQEFLGKLKKYIHKQKSDISKLKKDKEKLSQQKTKTIVKTNTETVLVEIGLKKALSNFIKNRFSRH